VPDVGERADVCRALPIGSAPLRAILAGNARALFGLEPRGGAGAA
jgi:hypothetical protein